MPLPVLQYLADTDICNSKGSHKEPTPICCIHVSSSPKPLPSLQRLARVEIRKLEQQLDRRANQLSPRALTSPRIRLRTEMDPTSNVFRWPPGSPGANDGHHERLSSQGSLLQQMQANAEQDRLMEELAHFRSIASPRRWAGGAPALPLA